MYDTVGELTEGSDPSPTPPLIGEGLSDSPFREKKASSSAISPCRGEREGWEGGWGVRFSEFANRIMYSSSLSRVREG